MAPDAAGLPPPDPRRARVRALAQHALREGHPTAWFERLYREADGDASFVPWADLRPNPALEAWAARPGALAGARRAAVVGCGLGHDAAHFAALGLEVTAFDVSERAVEWARQIHPEARVAWEVGDLLDLPRAWRGAFDLVAEVYTLQALPSRVRGAAADGLRALPAPGGRVFVFTRLRDDGPAAPALDEAESGPPWPLGRAEVARLLAPLEPVEPLTEAPDPAAPTTPTAFGVWRRP